MQRKLFVLFAALVLLSLVFAPISMANAQGPMPPPTPRPSQHPPQPPIPPRNVAGDRPFPNQSVAPLSQQASVPAVVGQSGLSFSYAQTFGVTDQPYLVDSSHLNGPNGLFIDSSNSLYVAEEMGHRALKYNSSGTNTLTLGQAGKDWQGGGYLAWAKDVAVRSSDGHIFVLYSPALTEFDATGTVIQTFPPADPWATGSDNGHFSWNPRGLAFGPGGYLYVSDTENHRIQILDVSAGTTLYVGTIGTTGITQTDNTGFNLPGLIAFDSLGRLYVVDTANYRAQRCTSSSPWTTWTCSTFFGMTGVWGNDLSHLGTAYGIGISPTDDIFIADSQNYRVLKCNTSGSCSQFAGATGVSGTDNSHFAWTADVAVDSSGNVFVSDYNNFRVQKFNSAGVYQSTIGVTGVPYLTDTSHFNSPWGITVAPDNSMYILENKGYRLVKLNASGVYQWSVGQAGVYGSDNTHLGSFWAGVESSPAVDSVGHIYVGDTGNDRVQIFNSNGSYYGTLGSSGTGNYGFACPTGVAINPVNGDIFVTDHCNYRIQVFTSGLVFKATIGVTGVLGTDNLHFSSPWGVAVDSSGNIFVADSDNYRLQKCQLIGGAPGYSCTTFAGVTGVSAGDFGHIGYPLNVKVDASGRVYVADAGNTRVQVYDSTGAYLTTIGGIWGQGSGKFLNPVGVALDAYGNIYVTDLNSELVQKYSLGTPGWRQSNINGFGDLANDGATSLSTFSGQLYSGTENSSTGAQIWRSSDGHSWSSVMSNGFGDVSNVGIDHLLDFNGNLYAGTYNYYNNWTQTNGGQLWRSADGSTWNQVTLTGLDLTKNSEILDLFIYNSQIYASTVSFDALHGTEIWRSSTGNNGDWTQVVPNGFGDSNNQFVAALESFGGYLFAGTNNGTTGGQVWRSTSGNAGSWTQVNTSGFGDTGNNTVSAFANYGSYLYASTRHSGGAGAEMWRCQTCDGSDWVRVVDNGFGNPNTHTASNLEILNGRLYWVMGNPVDGSEVWRTANGTTWEQVGFGGWGDANNVYENWDKTSAVFNNSLFIGTYNYANGGEVWQMLNQIYLPLILR